MRKVSASCAPFDLLLQVAISSECCAGDGALTAISSGLSCGLGTSGNSILYTSAYSTAAQACSPVGRSLSVESGSVNPHLRAPSTQVHLCSTWKHQPFAPCHVFLSKVPYTTMCHFYVYYECTGEAHGINSARGHSVQWTASSQPQTGHTALHTQQIL